MHKNNLQDILNINFNQLEMTKVLSYIISDHCAIEIEIDTDIRNTWKQEYALKLSMDEIDN